MVENRFRFLKIRDLADPNVGAKKLGRIADQAHPDDGAGGMTEEKNSLLPETLAQQIDQFARVAFELRDPHRLGREMRVEGFARAALIPLHHDEIIFERSVGVAERHVWNAGTAMQNEQNRMRAIASADLNPLLNSAEPHALERVDSYRERDRVRRSDLVLPPGAPAEKRARRQQKQKRCSKGNALEQSHRRRRASPNA